MPLLFFPFFLGHLLLTFVIDLMRAGLTEL